MCKQRPPLLRGLAYAVPARATLEPVLCWSSSFASSVGNGLFRFFRFGQEAQGTCWPALCTAALEQFDIGTGWGGAAGDDLLRAG